MSFQSVFPLSVAGEVQLALEEGRAIVALESTVITHGLPYPQNFELLNQMETLIRAEDATPATIILWKGKCHIGLGAALKSEIHHVLADSRTKVKKLGMRELPLAMAQKQSGGTTVSATMRLAHEAGIEVFATGGIGGVHRGWQESMDISMDLQALAEIPMIVVSAGCKAILDVAATLERLESLAVPVLGWQTDSFPLFYTSSSKYPVDSCQSMQELVSSWQYQRSIIRSHSAMLVVNPIPSLHSIPEMEMDAHILSAISYAKELGISGKALTPFLLDYLAGSTNGVSIRANLALLKNNALLAAQIAKALKEQR